MKFPALERERGYEVMGENRIALLVVSPHEEVARQVEEVFRGTNWAVGNCCTFCEAMQVLRENPPAVVLCEENLPDGTWKDVLDVLKVLRLSPPLIVTSRFADMELWVEVLHLGGYDLLAKPLTVSNVRWAVQSAWWQWDSRKKEQAARTQRAIA